jgi:hypothetical protein
MVRGGLRDVFCGEAWAHWAHYAVSTSACGGSHTGLPAVGTLLIVKFARTYSEAAHRACLRARAAPHLFAVQPLAGGFVI